MNLITQQHLGSLEILLSSQLHMQLPCHENGGYWHPFYWDVTQKAEFTPIALASDQGWMKQTDAEYALLEWLSVEESGFASPEIKQYWDGDDDAKILLTDQERQHRQGIYIKLIDYFKNTLSEVQAFSLSVEPDYKQHRQGNHWSFVMGKQPTGDWLAIAPTMPRETGSYLTEPTESFHLAVSPDIAQSHQNATELPDLLTALIGEVPPIKIYGWYDGGYNHTHTYGLQSVCRKSKEAVIKSLWQQTQFLEIAQFERFRLKSDVDYSRLSRFLQSAVSAPTIYRFCFWDIEMLYLLGQLDNGDCVGMTLKSQFTYNP